MANAEIHGKRQNSRYPWIRDLGLALRMVDIHVAKHRHGETPFFYPDPNSTATRPQLCGRSGVIMAAAFQLDSTSFVHCMSFFRACFTIWQSYRHRNGDCCCWVPKCPAPKRRHRFVPVPIRPVAKMVSAQSTATKWWRYFVLLRDNLGPYVTCKEIEPNHVTLYLYLGLQLLIYLFIYLLYLSFSLLANSLVAVLCEVLNMST